MKSTIQAEKNNGELPKLPDFYKSTHYDENKHQWVAPACKTNYVCISSNFSSNVVLVSFDFLFYWKSIEFNDCGSPFVLKSRFESYCYGH